MKKQHPADALMEMEGKLAFRWRLVLGPAAERAEQRLALTQGSGDGDDLARARALDEALEFVYGRAPAASRKADLSRASAYVPRWLDLLRRSLPPDVVTVVIQDGLKRRGLDRLLLEPEILSGLEPDPALIGALLALKDQVPDAARSAVRDLVEQLVNRLMREVKPELVSAVRRGLRTHPARRGSYRELDWPQVIRRNLRHYDPARAVLIPERFYFRAGERSAGEWRVLILVDQSGSMAESVIHAAVTAAILASIGAIETRLILFGAEIADVSALAADPVEVLLAAQIGGGTDIASAVAYASQFVTEPGRTILVLVSDLYEGGDADTLVAAMEALNDSECRTACILAITAEGRADYDEAMAARLAGIGTPSFAATPETLVPFLARLWGPAWPPEGLRDDS